MRFSLRTRAKAENIILNALTSPSSAKDILFKIRRKKCFKLYWSVLRIARLLIILKNKHKVRIIGRRNGASIWERNGTLWLSD